VFDVVVDIRCDSSSFLKYETFELSEDNGFALHVPAGCAHGFQVLDGPAELLYLHSEEYRPDYEAGINPFDSQLLIDWPVGVTQISERDKSFPSLHKSFKGITI
jgi:dTDP-4-dehydrorhamnose 3,5-epimerase